MSFSLVPAVIAGIKYGVVTGIMFLISALLIGWVALLITIFFYSLVSKFLSGERFKDILSYVQIGIGIGVMMVYQLVGNSNGDNGILVDGLPDAWWMYLLIPNWFTKLTLIATVPIDMWTWVSLALIVGTCFWGAKSIINLLAVKFYDILSSVSSGASKSEDYSKEVEGRWSLARVLCISSLERAGWRLSSTSVKRDRQFKQSMFPLLGYGFVFVIMLVVKEAEGGVVQTLENLRESPGFIFLLVPVLFFTMPLSYLRYTQSPDAAWVYHLIPEDRHYHILTGAIKACIMRFFVPPVLVLACVVSFIWGIAMIPAFILGSSITLFIALAGEFVSRELPLSLGYDQISKGSTSVRMFLLMLTNGLGFGLVYLLTKIHFGFTLGVLAFVILFIGLMMRALREN